MDIIVCVKRVPETAEVDLAIERDGKDIVKKDLVFDINEWDNYAMEEAVRIKENIGGTVTAVTLGEEDSRETLRRCLAMGADRAMILADPALQGSDAYATALALHRAIKKERYDLILTGVQASDDGYAQVGGILAEMLGIPHVTMVTKVDIQGKLAKVRRELEGGLEEELEVELPALFTIQTGINEPRYVSIMGIRKARGKEIRELMVKDLELTEDEVGQKGSQIHLEKVFLPPVEKEAEIIQGDPSQISERLLEIIKEKGGVI